MPSGCPPWEVLFEKRGRGSVGAVFWGDVVVGGLLTAIEDTFCPFWF